MAELPDRIETIAEQESIDTAELDVNDGELAEIIQDLEQELLELDGDTEMTRELLLLLADQTESAGSY